MIDYAQVVRGLPDAYLIVSPELTVQEATQAFFKLLGRAPCDLKGQTIAAAYPCIKPSSPYLQAVMRSLERVRETKLIDSIGIEEDARAWRVTHTPLFNERGDLSHILHRIEDVTEATRNCIRNMSDALPQLVWRTNPDGLADYCNKRLADYVGLSEDELMGAGWVSVIHPEDRDRAMAEWAKAREREEPVAVDFRIRGADGSYRWFLSRGNPYRDSTGKVTKYYGTWTDIEDTRAAQEAAELANNSKSAFLANISHEIRTPLGVIRGFAELIEEECELPPEQREWASTIRRNTYHLTAIIDELLDLSKIESNRFEVERIRFAFLTTVQDVLSVLQFKASEKDISLTLSTIGKLPHKIWSDPLRFKQILLNLLGNAIKFTSQGHVDVEIRQVGQTLQFLIRDTGIGIPEEQRDRLFQPFSQADSSTTRKFGGTGLGLYISQRLARALGGDLVLTESIPHVGSCFQLTIDCGELTNEDYVTTASPQEAHEKPKLQLAGQPNVLIADDSTDNQNLIKRILSRAGARVTVANNGREAVAKALNQAFDVILMDIQMPELDGYGATRALREANYHGPIIALTAHAMKEEREQCLRSGFDNHLSKPIDRQALIEAIRHYHQV